MLKFFVASLLLVIAAGLYVRFAPLNAESFHVDPETASRPSVPGHVLVRAGGDIEPPVFESSQADLAGKLEALILATPRTTKLSGDLQKDHATYVTRTALWGFPDIASVKVIDLGEGLVTLNILSRLRFGKYDFDVNRERVEIWLEQLQ